MMKKIQFEEAELEIVYFESEDVVTLSSGADSGDGGADFDPGTEVSDGDVSEGTPGAVRAKKPFAGRFYVLGDTVRPGGFLGENAGIMDVNTGEFQALREKRDVLGLFFGHDHNNSFVGTYQGMDLGYAQGCGFNCYGPGERRGVRVFVLDETKPDTYDTYTVSYGELFGAQYERPMVKRFYDHAASSVGEAVDMGKRTLKKVGIGVVCAFAAKGLYDTVIKRRNR